MDGCLDCDTHTICTRCDETNDYYLNEVTKECVACPVYGCDQCASMDECAVCESSFTFYLGTCFCQKGTYLDLDVDICIDCSPFCKYCTGPTAFECTSCIHDQNRVLVGTTCVCDEYNYQEPETGETCVKINNNKCDRGYIKIELTGECVEICGDGVLLVRECDDGNIVNGDGCSDQCKVEPHYVCSNDVSQISVCKLNTTTEIESVDVQKIPGENKLAFTIDITPDTDAYSNYNLKKVLEFENSPIVIEDAYYEDGKLHIEASYTDDVESKDVVLTVKEDESFEDGDPADPNYVDIYSSNKVTFKVSSSFIPIKTSNNLDAYHYSDEVYEEAEKMSTAADVVAITTVVGAFICLALKNSFSTLLIITNVQLIFFSLTAIEGMHPVSEALTHLKTSIGYNDPKLIPNNQGESANRRVHALGYDNTFANNFNVMLFCQTSMLVVSGLIYLVAQKRAIMKTPFKVLQKEALLLVLFNAGNFFFSIAMIRVDGFFNICFAVGASVIIIVQAGHFMMHAQQYYGMNETFNFEKAYLKVFFVGLLINRLGVCFCLSLISEDSLMSCIAAIGIQSSFIIMLAIVRPFLSMLTNAFLIASELMTLGAFTSIYVFEGLDGSESTGGWFLLGMSAGVGVMMLASIIHNTYMICTNTAKMLKINPESLENMPQASK